MSTLHSRLRIRLSRNLVLELFRRTTDPAHPYIKASWSATLDRDAGRGSRERLVFAFGGERTPYMDDDDGSLWVGGANFPIPADHRERVERWLADNEDTNTPEGADRAVSTGASHAGRDSAAGKPGDVNGAQQCTPPIEDCPSDLQRAGGRAAPPAGVQGSSLPVATVGAA